MFSILHNAISSLTAEKYHTWITFQVQSSVAFINDFADILILVVILYFSSHCIQLVFGGFDSLQLWFEFHCKEGLKGPKPGNPLSTPLVSHHIYNYRPSLFASSVNKF